MLSRNTIEAILKVTDSARFKGEMKGASTAIKGVGTESEKTTVKMTGMGKATSKTEHETEELNAALMMAQQSVDELGDEAVKTAAKLALLERRLKSSGKAVPWRRWAFWKDRLSLTRAEIMTTSLTIGGYLSPALVALASNAANAYAALGVVGGAGLASFGFGAGALGLIWSQTSDGIDKIRKAQDQYNIAVDQFGITSKEASRSSARLYAIIQNNGGNQALEAANAMNAITKAWKDSTGPARGNVIAVMTDGFSWLLKLMPTLTREVNRMAKGFRGGMGDFFQILSGGEFKATIRALGNTFTKSIGPGLRGTANFLIVVFRVIRAALPYAEKWALAWEDFTESLRRSTSDQGKVSSWVGKVVSDLYGWLGLLKEIGKTFKIVLGATDEEGDDIVAWLTKTVSGFNVWLQKMEDTGAIARFYDKFFFSLKEIQRFFKEPFEVMDQYLPKFLNAFARMAGKNFGNFIKHFFAGLKEADPSTQAFVIGLFALKTGMLAKILSPLAKPIKKAAKEYLGKPIGRGILDGIKSPFGKIGALIGMGAGKKGSEKVSTSEKFKTLGEKGGRLFGKGFWFGLTAVLADLVFPGVQKKIEDFLLKFVPDSSWFKSMLPPQLGGTGGGSNPFSGPEQRLIDPVVIPPVPVPLVPPKGFEDAPGLSPTPPRKRHRRFAGGILPYGSSGFVGEQGPELATVGPYGANITPLSRVNLKPQRLLDVPKMENAMHINLNTSVQVDRREIARAVSEERAYKKARRGG